MEATGVYWIPVYQILETAGFEVCLVNARYFQNVPGRKTDVSDCQWLQRLHAAGLLRGSFRPAQEVCVLRSLTRHRDNLIRLASTHVLHMQKALDQMNVQLHHVLSDITGLSGLAILDAILAGERDPRALARLRDGRMKASEETIVQALTGDYRAEHVFTLKQSLTAYRHYQKLIAACDLEIEQQLKRFDPKVDATAKPLAPPKVRRRKIFSNEPHFDLRSHLYRIFGVDLTAVPGISVLTAHTILSEIGPDISKFRSAAAFASWLALCPHNDISGGQNPERENAPCEQPSGIGIPHGGQRAVPEPIAAGRLLPPHAGQVGRAAGDYGSGAQVGAHRISHAHCAGSLRRGPPQQE